MSNFLTTYSLKKQNITKNTNNKNINISNIIPHSRIRDYNVLPLYNNLVITPDTRELDTTVVKNDINNDFRIESKAYKRTIYNKDSNPENDTDILPLKDLIINGSGDSKRGLYKLSGFKWCEIYFYMLTSSDWFFTLPQSGQGSLIEVNIYINDILVYTLKEDRGPGYGSTSESLFFIDIRKWIGCAPFFSGFPETNLALPKETDEIVIRYEVSDRSYNYQLHPPKFLNLSIQVYDTGEKNEFIYPDMSAFIQEK